MINVREHLMSLNLPHVRLVVVVHEPRWKLKLIKHNNTKTEQIMRLSNMPNEALLVTVSVAYFTGGAKESLLQKYAFRIISEEIKAGVDEEGRKARTSNAIVHKHHFRIKRLDMRNGVFEPDKVRILEEDMEASRGNQIGGRRLEPHEL